MSTGSKPCAAAETDPGQRSHNEDAFLLDEGASLYVVADGVGGREAGEVAAQLACETIAASRGDQLDLRQALMNAHLAIREAAEGEESPGRAGMACTAVALQFEDARYRLAWSGDSRAYYWDGRNLSLLTRDHSLVESLVARGKISRHEARDHPQRNVILSALGGDQSAPQLGFNSGSLSTSGTFLLCSDGLTDVLTYDEICSILATPDSIADRARDLTHLARDNGGRDNITTLLVDFDGEPDSGPGATVYENFDSESGAVSWPADSHHETTEPTVSRLRPRTLKTEETRFPTTGGGASRTDRKSPEPPPGKRYGMIVGALLAAIAMTAAIIFYIPLIGH